MLIKFKVKRWLAICHFYLLRLRGEQIPDMLLHQQGAAEDTHDLVDVSFKFHFMFDYRNETIGGHCRIYLNSYSGFSISPKGSHSQVLFYPFEEQLDLPTIFVKEYNLFRRKEEVVCIECKCTVELGNKRHYTSEGTRVVGSVTFPTEPDGLIADDIGSVVNHIISRLYNICRMVLLSDHKERIHLFNVIEPSQIPITSVKNISGQRLIINHIKSVDIMDRGFGDIEHSGYLCDYVQLCMELYPRLCASELRPFIDTQAQINSAGVKRIELTSDAEFSINTGLLRHINHVIGEFLKHMPIPMSIASGKDIPINWIFAKPKVKRLIGMSRRNISQVSETSASEELAEHENKQLPPIGQMPLQCAVFNSALGSAFHDSFKFSLWQKVNHLTENISSCMHRNSYRGFSPNIVISKVRQGISKLKIA